MNYEKKYKEALSRAKVFELPEYKKIAESIFPELAESEDERIRKAIIATIHLYYGEPLEDEAKEMIAWLEKQSEQILANSAKTCKDEQEPTDKVEPIDEYEGLTDFERTVADVCIGWIGKEIGWKEYIKDNLDILLKIAVEKFNSVQDAPFEQKPTDEEMKELLRTEYEKGRADAIAEMQKPAWSVEDMSKVQRICKYLDKAKKYYADITEVRECTNWLKSLKERIKK